MTARTLVIGIPLPHTSFDNYSFASAPSISEYTRLIVEMNSVATVIEDIVQGTGSHTTFAGQPVANAPTTSRSFSLADLLRMRRREAHQFFQRGGTALVVAYPDVPLPAIQGLEPWRLYDWLPQPDGTSCADCLLPGFGKTGVEVADPGHPFAPYIVAFGRRMSYRAHAPPVLAGARVFGVSAGGLPVAFDIPLLEGRIVFLPPVDTQGEDRFAIADTLCEGFERLQAALPERPPHWIRKEAP